MLTEEMKNVFVIDGHTPEEVRSDLTSQRFIKICRKLETGSLVMKERFL